jgi:hypothetical protein
METLGFITTHLPYWFYLGAMGVFDIVIKLPWPSGNEYLRLTLAFVSLYPVRVVARLMEKRTAKRFKKHGRETSGHQSAVSSLDDLFHH